MRDPTTLTAARSDRVHRALNRLRQRINSPTRPTVGAIEESIVAVEDGITALLTDVAREAFVMGAQHAGMDGREALGHFERARVVSIAAQAPTPMRARQAAAR